MKVPEFFRGSIKTREGKALRSFNYYRDLADRAENKWHELGHTSVKFRVLLEHTKRGDIYVIRSNLINGLPPKVLI